MRQAPRRDHGRPGPSDLPFPHSILPDVRKNGHLATDKYCPKRIDIVRRIREPARNRAVPPKNPGSSKPSKQAFQGKRNSGRRSAPPNPPAPTATPPASTATVDRRSGHGCTAAMRIVNLFVLLVQLAGGPVLDNCRQHQAFAVLTLPTQPANAIIILERLFVETATLSTSSTSGPSPGFTTKPGASSLSASGHGCTATMRIVNLFVLLVQLAGGPVLDNCRQHQVFAVPTLPTQPANAIIILERLSVETATSSTSSTSAPSPGFTTKPGASPLSASGHGCTAAMRIANLFVLLVQVMLHINNTFGHLLDDLNIHSWLDVAKLEQRSRDFVELSAQEQRPLKEAVVEYLGVYRCTPHIANGEKPAFLLHGRRPKTKLAIVGGPSRDFLRNPARRLASLREHMAQYQWKSKAYTDPPGSQGMLRESRLNDKLLQLVDGHSYVLYGDPAYPLRPLLLKPYGSKATPAQVEFNKAMSTLKLQPKCK
ncbi:protein ALP1-like [Ixodes scapularis]